MRTDQPDTVSSVSQSAAPEMPGPTVESASEMFGKSLVEAIASTARHVQGKAGLKPRLVGAAAARPGRTARSATGADHRADDKTVQGSKRRADDFTAALLFGAPQPVDGQLEPGDSGASGGAAGRSKGARGGRPVTGAEEGVVHDLRGSLDKTLASVARTAHEAFSAASSLGHGKTGLDAQPRPRKGAQAKADSSFDPSAREVTRQISLETKEHPPGTGGGESRSRHRQGTEQMPVLAASDGTFGPADVDAPARAPSTTPAPLPLPDLDPLIASLGARVSMSAGEAQISLDAGAAGDLSLYLRVHDGKTDVRVEGTAAHLVDARVPELKAALSQEGLSLGSFALGGQASGGDPRGDANKEPPLPSPVAIGTSPALTKNSQSMTPTHKHHTGKRRLHVTA